MTPDHVIFVVHGMGNQYKGHGKYHQNLSCLHNTCMETMNEEFDCNATIKWIPIGTTNINYRMAFKIT
jgi:hypothetical protein